MVYQKISKSASSNAQSPDKSVSIVPQSVPVSLTPIAHFHDFTQVPVYSPTIQAKLTIGSPNDRYEQEADRVAAQVVQQLQRPASIQRQDELDETIQAKSLLQRPDSIVTGEASTQLASEIDRQRGGGQSLDVGLQQSMGLAMGADFSRVRVHTDSQSDQLNRSIQAKAFTTGQDVFFRQGTYNPGSLGGQELIAHELAHVLQQNAGVVQRRIVGLSAKQTVGNFIVSKNIQRSLFSNWYSQEFGKEIDEAAVAAIKTEYENGPGPYVAGTQGFMVFLERTKGSKFKWIYSDKNGLVVISPTLKHAVAAGGADVITAGMGLIKDSSITLDNETGHYRTTLKSLALAEHAWRKIGINSFTYKERVDFQAVLGGMGKKKGLFG